MARVHRPRGRSLASALRRSNDVEQRPPFACFGGVAGGSRGTVRARSWQRRAAIPPAAPPPDRRGPGTRTHRRCRGRPAPVLLRETPMSCRMIVSGRRPSVACLEVGDFALERQDPPVLDVVVRGLHRLFERRDPRQTPPPCARSPSRRAGDRVRGPRFSGHGASPRGRRRAPPRRAPDHWRAR